MSHLALFLFGPPRIEYDAATIEIPRRKAVALLVYLAVTGTSHSRNALANLLWPEYDQRRARADLRRTLSVLNKALPGDWLVTDREIVSLNEQNKFWLDVKEFRDLLAECQHHGHPPNEVCPACLPLLTRAVRLYPDDFLAGFTLSDSTNFDEWQFFQTEQLRGELIRALTHLVHGHIDRGELEAAIPYAQRRLELDPLDETAHYQLMQLYAQTGQQTAAIRQYQACVETLDRELGVSPQAETSALYERIRTGNFIQQGGNSATSSENVSFTSSIPAAALHNLPVQPTPFIGRRRELAAISNRLANPACRLLTLIGPGGVGKTRLGLEAAARAASTQVFTHGVYFVPLAPLTQANFLVSAIGHVLKLSFYGPESFNENPRAQLLDYLRGRKMLLVLDNFEHMLSKSDLLVDILETAPQVKILVTSQERLNLQAEWVLEVSGMRVPEEDEREGLEDYSAIRLFIQNAQRAQADFVLTEEDKPYVIRICRLVGGMPLGIQLASAWVRLLSCQEIVQEIEHNLDFLATSLRDLPERHRSLRVVFDHSWSLLSDEERRVYRQLSVFHGGFRRPAAEHVAHASLSVLSALVDKSFLHRNPSGRYEIHEVLRQYAAEKLHTYPQEEEETQTRYGEYYAAFLEPKLSGLKGSKQRETVVEMGEEVENLRAIWRWAIDHGRIDIIEKCLESLYRFYEMRGWVAEGEAAFNRAVEGLTHLKYKQDAPPREALELTLAKVMAHEGALCSRLGLSEKAHRLLQQSLAIFRRAEDESYMAFTLNYLGALARLRGDYEEAGRLWQESLAIYRYLDDRWGAAWTLNFWGHMLGEHGQYLEAKQMLQESLSIHQELGNQRGMAGALNGLGYAMYLLGEYEEARSLLQKSLVIRREVGYRRGIAISLNYLGCVAEALDELQESRKYFQEALKLALEIRDIPLTLSIILGIATALAKEGKSQDSLELLYFPLHHPSAGQETRDKAQQLYARLESQLPVELVMISQTAFSGEPQQFEEMIARYLRDHIE